MRRGGNLCTSGFRGFDSAGAQAQTASDPRLNPRGRRNRNGGTATPFPLGKAFRSMRGRETSQQRPCALTYGPAAIGIASDHEQCRFRRIHGFQVLQGWEGVTRLGPPALADLDFVEQMVAKHHQRTASTRVQTQSAS